MAFPAKASTHMLCARQCRNGNFTAPMSRNFRKVVGTEIAKESVKLANDNMAQNGCTPNLQPHSADWLLPTPFRACLYTAQVIMSR